MFFFVKVHTFYRNCNGHASCNCAVAVKSGDDVILIDRCGPDKGKSVPVDLSVFANGDITPGTRIYRFLEGKRYEVCSFVLLSTFWMGWIITNNFE